MELLKQALSAFMMFANVLFIILFAFMATDPDLSVFAIICILLLVVDLALSVDYIRILKRQAKVKADQERDEQAAEARRIQYETDLENLRQKVDQALATEVKQGNINQDIDTLEKLLKKDSIENQQKVQ